MRTDRQSFPRFAALCAVIGCFVFTGAARCASAGTRTPPARSIVAFTNGAHVCRLMSGRVRVATFSGIHLVLDDTSLAVARPPESRPAGSLSAGAGSLSSPFDGTLNVVPMDGTVVTLADGRTFPKAGDHIAVQGYEDGSYFVAEKIADVSSPTTTVQTPCRTDHA